MSRDKQIDIEAYNRRAWNCRVDGSDRWTKPVDTITIQAARRGEFQALLTPSKPVPASWFPPLPGSQVLCLASGGGQQGPVLAAAGAAVTAFDNSPRQLDQDRYVAEREGLSLKTVVGDMADLSVFASDGFDLIFHPIANCFVPEIQPIWNECFRVLKPGGVLLAGFTNPIRYLFDDERAENGNLEVRYSIPYSDLKDLPESDCKRLVFDRELPLEFGHTLDDQIGGQLAAGFVLTGFFEDRYDLIDEDPISQFIATYIATRAVKPK